MSVKWDLDREDLIKTARVALSGLFGEAPTANLPADDYPSFERVNVTLRVGGHVRGSMSGQGRTLQEQIRDAVRRSAQDVRFAGPLVFADLTEVSVEVWIQLAAEVVDVTSTSENDILTLGVHGVDVQQGSRAAYYKPSVALTSEFSSVPELLSAVCSKAKLSPEAWKTGACTTRRTKWLHFAETPTGSPTSLVALRQDPNEIIFSKNLLHGWLEESLSYLMNNQQSNGEMCYKYNPLLDSANRGSGNPVRSSGCAYALAAASSYEDFGIRALLPAQRAAENILKRLSVTPQGLSFINDNPAGQAAGGKLGTTALLALALLTPALRNCYSSTAEKLMIGIRSQQMSDGNLTCTYGSALPKTTQINFFPGQALLACVVYSASVDDSYREVYRNAFLFYREHFMASPTTAFIGWHVDVWSKAAILDRNQQYADFVFHQIDWLLRFQCFQPESLEHGSFPNRPKPPNYSTIVYVEAIARAADLAYTLGDLPRYERYQRALLIGLRFCSLLRLNTYQGIFLPSPQRAYGGVTMSLTRFLVRSDVVQHAMTLALALLERPHLLSSRTPSVEIL